MPSNVLQSSVHIVWDVQPCAIPKVVLECRSTGPKKSQARCTFCISIKEGIHHGIDHLPRVRRRCFGQSFRLRPLRLSSPRRKRSAGNTHRLGHTKPALLHRVRGDVTARCSFLHVVRGTSWNPSSFRRIPALANPPSSCPTASARVAHAARAKAKRARGSQMPKVRIHACHHRRAGLFDHLRFHGRRQHRKPLRQMRL